MQTKIRIQIGQVELEYEGEDTFLKGGLLALLKDVFQVAEDAKIPLQAPPVAAAGQSAGGATLLQGTTGSIAAKLKVTSEQDLIIAAATRLTLVSGEASFPRDSILAEMKTATAYYKQSYSGGNLTKGLNALVKQGKLTEVAKDRYALAASTRHQLEAAIGN
jgi:hypothetical protein